MRKLVFILLVVIMAGCDRQQKVDENYLAQFEKWKVERLAKLKGEKGYVNLAGLFWLEPGTTTFGNDENDLSFGPLADQMLGTLQVDSNMVALEPTTAPITLAGTPVTQRMIAYHDTLSVVPEFHYKSLRWTVIKRGDQFGIRLRDLEHPMLTSMEPIEYFPADPSMRVEATFEPYDPPKMVMTANVLGMNYLARVPGMLRFELGGNTFRMEPNIDGEYLHLRFTDETTGEDTYGLGRYLHAAMPDANNMVILDFNKAYNPPCAFTEFATCPIPPKQNHIPFRLAAGEKGYGEH